MLKGVDPWLNADVLYALRDMGHGDVLILADQIYHPDPSHGKPCRATCRAWAA